MLSGKLSASRQRTLRNMFLVPVALLALLAITGVGSIHHPSGRYSGGSVLVLLAAIPAMMLYLMAQYRQRSVSLFEYDGASLRYETLGQPESRSFSTDELHDIQ